MLGYLYWSPLRYSSGNKPHFSGISFPNPFCEGHVLIIYLIIYSAWVSHLRFNTMLSVLSPASDPSPDVLASVTSALPTSIVLMAFESDSRQQYYRTLGCHFTWSGKAILLAAYTL